MNGKTVKKQGINNNTKPRLKMRQILPTDQAAMEIVTRAAYPKLTHPHWTSEQLITLLSLFPKGQICLEHRGVIIAFALCIIVDYSKFEDDHNYEQITGNFSFSTHNNNGDILYGIDICVHPEFRNLRLGRRLYNARKEICENLNLKGIVIGGRMPRYHKFSYRMKPKEYIEKVRVKKIYDPVLFFQLTNGFHVKKIVPNYLPSDKQSHANAIIMRWDNIYYEKPQTSALTEIKSVVRIGMVQ